jgi:uncharacterized membrane protein
MSQTTTTTSEVAPQAGHRNGLGISAFVLGLAGSVVGLIPILSIPALISGLIGFGLGLGGLRRLRRRTADNRVMTWVGTVFSVLAVVLGIVGMVIVAKAFNQLGTDLGNIGGTTTGTGAAG